MGGKYIYAVEVGDNVVKVGKSLNPQRRFGQFALEGYTVGERFQTPEQVRNHGDCERMVCDRLSSDLVKGREWFACDIEKAINVINDIFSELGENIPEEDKCAGKKRKMKVLPVYFTEAQYNAVKDEAGWSGLAMSSVVTQLVQKYLVNKGGKK